MDPTPDANAAVPSPAPALPPRRAFRRRLRQGLLALAAVVLAYVAVAYVAAPTFWRARRPHPGLEDAPRVTRTGNGISGDPVNLALVGTEEELLAAFRAAGWHTADPITPRTAWRMSQACSLGRPYLTAPVSNLYLWDRKQDHAFQVAEGKSPRRRHHVRFWRSPELDADGRPLWLGAATFDRSVGIDVHTLQFTHHIDADVDAERDRVIADLGAAGCLIDTYRLPWVGEEWRGRNGGYDPFVTDGFLVVGVLAPPSAE
ncbi:MAG TPA: LssY C-terminal domain-containing protein [Gemmataceae bacterium]|nr:LssY C-terminal domain-containing protein [Gemmataceae bacterium]